MRESARWPVVARAGEPEARDPAGDDRVPPDLGWSDHLRCWGSGDPASYRDDALRFLDAVRAARRGLPAPQLAPLAARLRLSHPLGPHRHRPLLAARPVPLADLVRVSTDLCPDADQEAGEWALGPWADAIAVGDPLGRRALAVALAWHGFTEREDGFTTFERWCNGKFAPPESERAAVRAIGTAPVGLWRVRAVREDTVILDDALGLSARFRPVGPARLERPGGVVGDLSVGGGLLARVAPLADGGWWVGAGLALPALPPPALVRRWIHLDLLVARLGDRRLRREVFLSRRGVSLARAVHEWLWSTC